MKPIRFHIMRNIRLRLKTGFMETEPIEYTFMKRYPPLTRDTDEPYHKMKVETIPYINLYKKVVERNPIYVDEKVYGAYWMYEPQALTLAKKQYDLMQAGMEEEEAYQQARKHVEVLENEAYLEMKKVTDSIKQAGAKSPILQDAAVAEELSKWKAKARSVGIDYMQDEDLGDLTYFIHDKILKWNEVERERRMKDIPFVEEFQHILESLFPTISEDLEDPNAYVGLKEAILDDFDFDKTKGEPFYVEDYITHFNKVKNQPDIRKWSSEERSVLSLWIIKALTYKEMVDSDEIMELEKYLKTTRSLFFPMLVFPQRAAEFEMPSLQKMKKLLFENGIGYKKGEDGKLFVNRFYRIPRLLFPKAIDEIEALILAAEEQDDAQKKSQTDTYKRMNNEGDYDDEFDTDEDMEYADDEIDPNQSFDIKTIDECNDSFDTPFTRVPREPKESAQPKKPKLTSRLDEFLKSNVDVLEHPEFEVEDKVETVKEVPVIADDELWRKTFAKYYQYPTTPLEKVRERYFRSMEAYRPEIAQNEDEMLLFEDYRMRNVIISRSTLAKKYQDREAARRRADWERRGVWLDKFKPQGIRFVDN